MAKEGVVLSSDAGWYEAFCATLRETGNVRASCDAAGISRVVAYRHRKKYPAFRELWDVALEEAIDKLEAIATMRAMYSSDTLLIFLLKAHRPAKYREVHRVDLANADDKPFRFTLSLDGGAADEEGEE